MAALSAPTVVELLFRLVVPTSLNRTSLLMEAREDVSPDLGRPVDAENSHDHTRVHFIHCHRQDSAFHRVGRIPLNQAAGMTLGHGRRDHRRVKVLGCRIGGRCCGEFVSGAAAPLPRAIDAMTRRPGRV
jgi:hypothetical protein